MKKRPCPDRLTFVSEFLYMSNTIFITKEGPDTEQRVYLNIMVAQGPHLSTSSMDK